jgi:K+-transporting ATPase ATPase C chain
MSDFKTSLRLVVFSLVVCSVAYPAAILGFAALAAPDARQGSLIRDEDGTVIGSRLLAQDFTRPDYFWPRPSAVAYDASATGGSNLSPTNPALTENARAVIERLKPSEGQRVPADLVSASGSGMDPHITLSAALFQAPRVASARNLPVEKVEQRVRDSAETGILATIGGEPLVNVLLLNRALDEKRD